MSIPAGFLPMLAPSKYVLPRFPCLASRKYDGYRAVVFGGVVYSRNLKPIANEHVQRLFGRPAFEGLDGELIVGAPNESETFRRTSSAVSRRDGEPPVRFFVFDYYDRALPFVRRLSLAAIPCRKFAGTVLVEHVLIHNEEELQAFETKCLKDGYEGAMTRDPGGPYKHDRATTKEGWLLKIKHFLDTEALIVGVAEEQQNTNAAVVAENGKPKRSSHQENMVGKGTLGALICKGIAGKPFAGEDISIGSGFSKAERQLLWHERASLPGKIAKFKYFPTGGKTGPRFPVFLGFRAADDA